nr:hypothetical protein HmN_000150600 [Hymenolepis microstoma]
MWMLLPKSRRAIAIVFHLGKQLHLPTNISDGLEITLDIIDHPSFHSHDTQETEHNLCPDRDSGCYRKKLKIMADQRFRSRAGYFSKDE